MTSYFWSGFPSLSGRPRVMYGRRHIGEAAHPLLRHPYRLGLLRLYRLSYRSPTFFDISEADPKSRRLEPPPPPPPYYVRAGCSLCNVMSESRTLKRGPFWNSS